MEKRYLVWNLELELVGRYDDRGEANRACKNAGAGAAVCDERGNILGWHPRTSRAQEGRMQRAESAGKLVAPAERARAPRPSTPPPAPAPEAPPEVDASVPALPAVHRTCSWAEEPCTNPPAPVGPRTHAAWAGYCAMHRHRARGRDYAARMGRTPREPKPAAPDAATATPPPRITPSRLRDAEARFVERHPDVVAARRDLAAFEERARAEFHAKMRELFGEPAADAAE